MSDLFKVFLEELIKELLVDVSLSPLLALVCEESPGDDFSGYVMQDGLLCRKWVTHKHSFTCTALQVVVPIRFRGAVLAHNGIAGHTGL